MRTVKLDGGYELSEGGVVTNKDGYEMAIGRNAKGYSHVTLYVGGRVKTYRLARLLARYFIPNPDLLSDVDHIDADRENHKLDNLRWVSHGNNIKHSYDLGNRSAKGESNANSKLSEEQVNRICSLFEKGYTVKEVSDGLYYCSYAMAYKIKKRESWTYISDHYLW